MERFLCTGTRLSILYELVLSLGLPWWLRGLLLWLSWCRICLQGRRTGFDPWVGKIPWRRERLPTLVLFSHQGSQIGLRIFFCFPPHFTFIKIRVWWKQKAKKLYSFPNTSSPHQVSKQHCQETFSISAQKLKGLPGALSWDTGLIPLRAAGGASLLWQSSLFAPELFLRGQKLPYLYNLGIWWASENVLKIVFHTS